MPLFRDWRPFLSPLPKRCCCSERPLGTPGPERPSPAASTQANQARLLAMLPRTEQRLNFSGRPWPVARSPPLRFALRVRAHETTAMVFCSFWGSVTGSVRSFLGQEKRAPLPRGCLSGSADLFSPSPSWNHLLRVPRRAQFHASLCLSSGMFFVDFRVSCVVGWGCWGCLLPILRHHVLRFLGSGGGVLFAAFGFLLLPVGGGRAPATCLFSRQLGLH